ncbi:MAG: IS66 family insertion sequence element accessory protein TnpB [Polyangiaceae bacterium]|nr:IS66 family insertion sequence element accessory protein TnpB [Polyangiaceae bacterium]
MRGVYLFFNRRRRLAKALWFDGSELLAQQAARAGQLPAPRLSGDEKTVAINGAAFASLLAGIDFTVASARVVPRGEHFASIGDRHPRSGVIG